MGGEGFDLFDLISGRGRQRGPMKAKPKVKELNVKLEDVYTGKVMKVNIKRKRPCEACEGKGGANAKTCTTCKG